MNAPQAASTISTAIRGSALPAVATPSAMIADSLGTSGMRASSAGRAAATAYDAGDETSSAVRPINCVPGGPGQRVHDQRGRGREWSMPPSVVLATPVRGVVRWNWSSSKAGRRADPAPAAWRPRGDARRLPAQARRGHIAARPEAALAALGCGAGFDAELVALRVPHDRVARVAPRHDGPERLQPGHLGADRTGGTQVEVHAVLGRLELGDPDEPDVRPAPARRLDERLVGGRLLIHVRPEDGRPEPGQRQRVRGVERDCLDHARHAWHGSRGSPGRSLRLASAQAAGSATQRAGAAWTA